MLNVPLPSPPVPTTSMAPVRRLDAHDALAHRGREPGELVDGLAAHPQTHEQRGELRRRRLAVHDRAHRKARVVHRERAALDDRGERGPDLVAHRTSTSTSSAASARPRPARRSRTSRRRRRAATPRPRRRGAGSWPAGAARRASARSPGGTGPPRAAAVTCRMPMTTRSCSLIAVTMISGGRVRGSIASEW